MKLDNGQKKKIAHEKEVGKVESKYKTTAFQIPTTIARENCPNTELPEAVNELPNPTLIILPRPPECYKTTIRIQLKILPLLILENVNIPVRM